MENSRSGPRSVPPPHDLANPPAHPPSVASAVSAARTGNSQAALEPPPLTATEQHYLNEGELARRWGLSPKTLQRWRSEGVGAVFVKFSRRVAYPLQGPGGILDLEQRSRYRSTSQRLAPGGRE